MLLLIQFLLINRYLNGNDKVGWHAERTELNNLKLQLSLGAGREFKIRKNLDKSRDTVHKIFFGAW